jgi:hypothetical protein
LNKLWPTSVKNEHETLLDWHIEEEIHQRAKEAELTLHRLSVLSKVVSLSERFLMPLPSFTSNFPVESVGLLEQDFSDGLGKLRFIGSLDRLALERVEEQTSLLLELIGKQLDIIGGMDTRVKRMLYWMTTVATSASSQNCCDSLTDTPFNVKLKEVPSNSQLNEFSSPLPDRQSICGNTDLTPKISDN